MNESGTITVLLVKARSGDRTATDRLFEHVYVELKRMAGALLFARAWRPGDLESTALVNAACERLLDREKLDAQDRRHFYFVLSRAMKDVLVEQARADMAAKRGGEHKRVDMVEVADPSNKHVLTVLDVHDALEELRGVDPEAADVVMLRFFGGRSLEEIGDLIGLSYASVRRNWEYARAWLHARLADFQSGSREF